jgi:pimeloyl-ACP methyl ester carboxylesterase
MPHVRANSIEVYYEVHGDGPATPLVMSHGLGATSNQWLPQLLPLTDERPLIVWDVRGHGQTTAPEDEAQYSIEIFARDLAGLLDAIGVERAHIGGQSLGGMISARFALEYPSRCASLVLSDTSAGNGFDEGEAGKWERWTQSVIGNRARVVDEFGLEEAMRREYTLRKAKDPEFRDTPYSLDDYLRRARTTPAAGYSAAARAIVDRPDLTPRLSEIKAPTLVMVGERDWLAPCARRDHGLIEGSRFVLRRGCAHGFRWRLDTFVAELEAFLADVEAARPVAGERTV